MSTEPFRIDLGKHGFKKFTKSALVEMLEDAVMEHGKRTLPAHKRDEVSKQEKDDDAVEADEEREKLADLAEETHGKPAPIEMGEEDLSDKAMDRLKKTAKAAKPKTKKV